MPKALERTLRAEAKTKGLSKERTNAYVYGALRKTGWIPSTQKKKHLLKKTLHVTSKRR